MGTYEVSPNGEYVCDYPSIKFTNGNYTPVSLDWFKGRNSLIMFQCYNTGTLYDVTSGSFGGGNAAGNFRYISSYNGAVRYPQAGEIFDRVASDGTVLQTDVFRGADATNLNYLATFEHCNFMKSAPYGACWAYYINNYLSKTGHHCLFCEGSPVLGDYGETIDVYAEQKGFGWWGIGSADNLAAQPYAAMVAALP